MLYLLSEEAVEAYYAGRVFCDLDDVLADFKRGCEMALGRKWKDIDPVINNPKTHDSFVEELKKAKPDFWETLPWTPNGHKLWSAISKHDPIILTAYPETWKESIPQKHEWCKRNLGLSKSRVLCVQRRDKYKFARLQGMANILIDDFHKNVSEWNDAGGKGILHKDTNIKATTKALDDEVSGRAK